MELCSPCVMHGLVGWLVGWLVGMQSGEVRRGGRGGERPIRMRVSEMGSGRGGRVE